MSFAPYAALASALLPQVQAATDGAHDLAHLQRVWGNVRAISAEEGGDGEILAAAKLLHDCVGVEKDSPLRAQASRLAAARAADLLRAREWPEDRVAAVAHAIEAHSFSAGIAPTTPEARILQDADRLDAIGMVGVARCFYIAGRMGSALYDAADPEARHRSYDDTRFAIDHFQTKLLGLAAGFQTRSGARLAAERHARLRRFLDEFMQEVGCAA
ncbi:HD domain-containing protein [Desertibaculum subflavum]|uniref:HD domain-containing protein n=1 Tax=Desertibaculum subflavum TaxID=2268458 RepID=UPI000E66C0F3